jgi:hypothetical protein
MPSEGLPPFQRVRSLVDKFLTSFNAVLPLFRAQDLLRIVEECYHDDMNPPSPVKLAAVNVVLALTHRHVLHGKTDGTTSLHYLKRAQSMVPAIVEAETQLLTVQVLIGIAILLRGSPDQQPPLILTAIIFRLIHKIGLHSRASFVDLDPAEAQQRSSVFWIAYILDKDLSMREKQPSIQRDDDINHSLPSTDNYHPDATITNLLPDYASGADAAVTNNYFLARTQLAIVEGGVYDYLYSARSQMRSPEERSKALESVSVALEQWRASLPPEFEVATAVQSISSDLLPFIGIIHSTYFLCTTLINQAHAWNAQWVESLQSNARLGTSLVMPPSWNLLVDEARNLAILLQALPELDSANFW